MLYKQFVTELKMLACKLTRMSQRSKMFSTTVRCFQQQTSNESTADSNKPVKYLNSEAHKWKAEYSRCGKREDPTPWYQPYVVSASLTVFLVYFCIIREESDIDMKLSQSLYSQIDGLEEVQLRLSYNYNKEHGIDVADIERRMKELGMSDKQ